MNKEQCRTIANIDIILNITSENVKEVASEALRWNLPRNRTGIFLLTKTIALLARVRPEKFMLCVELFKEICTIANKELSSQILDCYVRIALSNDCREAEYKIRNFFLLRCMYLAGLYSPEYINSILVKYTEFVNYSHYFALYIFFAPEIEKIHPRFFDNVNIVNFPYSDSVKEEFDRMKADNWSLFNETFKLGTVPGTIKAAIINDDVDELIKYSARPAFAVNMRIQPSIFEHRSMLQRRPTLLQIAAMCRSVKCVKYLLLQTVNIDEKDKMGYNAMCMAVAGGNHEIVRLIEQSGATISGAAHLAVEYFRDDIFEWVRNTYDVSMWRVDGLMRRLVHSAALVDNLKAFCIALDAGDDLEEKTPSGATPLILSLINNSLFVAQAIIDRIPRKTLFECNYYNKNLIQLVIERSTDDTIIFLIDLIPEWDHSKGTSAYSDSLICAVENRRATILPQIAQRIKNPNGKYYEIIADEYDPFTFEALVSSKNIPFNYSLFWNYIVSFPLARNIVLKYGFVTQAQLDDAGKEIFSNPDLSDDCFVSSDNSDSSV